MAVDESRLLEKPIVVIGAPRSGTTQLGKILSCHPHLAYLEEPRLIWKYGNDAKSDLLRPEDARPEVIGHIRRSFAAFVREQGKLRLLEKTPSNALRLGFVDRVLPGCKFVHITRHGVEACLASLDFWQNRSQGFTKLAPGRVRQRWREVGLRRLPHYLMELARRAAPGPLRRMLGPSLWGPRIPAITALLKELDVLDVCCWQWRMCVELACVAGRRLPPDRYLEVRLEDMGPQTIRRVLQFCELEEDPRVLEAAKPFDQQRAQRRLREADPEQIARIRQWIEPTLQWLGYE